MGGMAELYLVTDHQGQHFVLRVMRPELRARWGRIAQFRWGCKVLSCLDHPNVIHFYGRGKFRGSRYAVLEYADGPNLKEAILRADPMLRAHQLQLLVGMAAGLAHVHQRGFVHLDFKPENVIVPKNYQPKLIDFDLAIKRPRSPKRIRTLSGTPLYLAPEQLARRPVDERADIFSFGMTAYEMLTGKKPIAGDTRDEILKKYAHFKDNLKPLRAHVPDIRPSLERLILKCLEKDPDRRYPTMGLVVRDLQS